MAWKRWKEKKKDSSKTENVHLPNVWTFLCVCSMVAVGCEQQQFDAWVIQRSVYMHFVALDIGQLSMAVACKCHQKFEKLCWKSLKHINIVVVVFNLFLFASVFVSFNFYFLFVDIVTKIHFFPCKWKMHTELVHVCLLLFIRFFIVNFFSVLCRELNENALKQGTCELARALTHNFGCSLTANVTTTTNNE